MKRDLLSSSLKAVREGREAAKLAGEIKANRLSGVLDVQRGLDQLAAGAPRSINPKDIAGSAVKDRFDVQDGLEDLVASIRASGQKLPVLLRRIKGGPLPYEVVYGRRRIEACRQLGLDVQAYISEMDDREALISQGLENAARLQRSFIEQAVYAEQLLRHDFNRDEVCEVLAIDKTTLSRMLGVVEAIPEAVIAAIGPAHDSGRRPWMQLKDILIAGPLLHSDELIAQIPQDRSSTERLQSLLAQLSRKTKAVKTVVQRALQEKLHIERSDKKMLIRCTNKDLSGFTEYLDERLDQLLSDYLSQNKAS